MTAAKGAGRWEWKPQTGTGIALRSFEGLGKIFHVLRFDKLSLQVYAIILCCLIVTFVVDRGCMYGPSILRPPEK
jgi:hypothetical protein